MKNRQLFAKMEATMTDIKIFEEVVMEISYLEKTLRHLEFAYNEIIRHSPEALADLKTLEVGEKVKERFGEKRTLTFESYLADKIGGEEYIKVKEEDHYRHLVNFERL